MSSSSGHRLAALRVLACALLVIVGIGPVSLGAVSAQDDTSEKPSAPVPVASDEQKPDEQEADLPSDYVVGPEDVLGILVWREPDMSGDVAVRSDGMITLPLVGDLRATGHTPEELADKVETVISQYLTEPNVTVIVRQINSRRVFITGEVAGPGVYPLGGPLNVMQLIALAGGLSEFADKGGINIMRTDEQGQTRLIKFNYDWVRDGRRLDQNILLKPGDTVVVP